MDLGRVEIAHELQYLAAEHLAGHQDRESWRVGRYVSRRHDIDSRVKPFINLLAGGYSQLVSS